MKGKLEELISKINFKMKNKDKMRISIEVRDRFNKSRVYKWYQVSEWNKHYLYIAERGFTSCIPNHRIIRVRDSEDIIYEEGIY